jgi:murein hydrolase activator
VRDEMSRKKEEKERLQREADELSSKVEKDQAQMKNVEQSLMNTRRKQSEVQQQVAAAKNRHDMLLEKLESRRDAYHDSARAYAVASVIGGPHELAPVYIKQAIRLRATETREVSEASAEERKALQSLVEAQSILRYEADLQQEKLGNIRDSRRDKEKQLTKTMTRQELVDAEIRELRHTAEELASLIEVLRSKAKQDVEEEKRARSAKQMAGHSPILPHTLSWPVTGKVVTRFGRQQHATLGTPFISNGIVIETPEKTDVKAVSDGKVLYAGEFMGYGGTVVVEHPDDWYSVYARLSGWAVEKGQAVKRGEMVGQSRTKQGGGGEAYFELRFYGKPTDPMPWLSSK